MLFRSLNVVVSKSHEISFQVSKWFSAAIITFLFLYLLSCDDNPVDKNPPCPPIQIVSTPPYNSPVWHPNRDIIGFNYRPLKKITYPYGEHCQGIYQWDSEMTGFWLINADGSNPRRVLHFRLNSPAWSPDGNWIVYDLTLGNERHIFKMSFDGESFDTTSIVQLTFDGKNSFPTWSPNGEWIAFDSNNEDPNGMYFIWTMKSDGSQKKRIAYEPLVGEIRMPSWSANSDIIVHCRYAESVVFTMNKFGNNPIRLTSDQNFHTYPKYSTDGTKIAYTTDGVPAVNIWLMDPNGNNQKQLTNEGVDRSFGSPFSWSPNGDKIVYTRYREFNWTYENGVLWTIDINTGEEKQLTFNPKPNN